MEEITQKDLNYLNNFVDYIEWWAYKHKDTAKKLEIGKKITGFVGEALTFRELKKHFKIEWVWKGGVQGGYDIHVKGSKTPIKISVKTTSNAFHSNKKSGDTYQWSLSWKDKETAEEGGLCYIFVDLKMLERRAVFYVVPSKVIRKHFKYKRRDGWNWPRYHPELKEINKYRSNWSLLKE